MSTNPETVALLETDSQDAEDAGPKEGGEEASAEAESPKGNSTPASNDAQAPTSNATEGNATGEASPNITNVTNATNTTTEEVNTTTAGPTGCTVKEDPRATAWFMETSPEGTPCVFGVDGDVRDEGSHCIFDNGDFGSNGWCYTAKDRSAWGSCNDLCPLYGPAKQLGKKIDHMSKQVDTVLDKLNGTSKETEATMPVQDAETVTEAPKSTTEPTKGPKAPAANASLMAPKPHLSAPPASKK